MTNNTVPFKVSLKAARVNANLTQKEACKALGITQKTLLNYESGATMPNWETVDKMSRLYGIPIDFFFLERKLT